jgi:pimeloyl-ACP methyl ester carboxylesterase
VKRLAIAAAAVTSLVLLLRRVIPRETLDWETVAKPGRVAFIEGYGVHYVEQGAGPAVVLLHGFGGHTYSFRNLIPALAEDHRVVAVDLKGFGYSQRHAHAGLSQRDQVAMLGRLLDALTIEDAVLIGHSMGGAVAQRFALAHPQRVRALVLIASMSAAEPRRAAMGRLPLFVLRPILPLLGAVVADRLLRASFCDPSLLTPGLRDEYLRPVRIKGSMDGLLAMIRDTADDQPADLERVVQPVLLLYGAEDRVAPPDLGERLRARIAGARLVVVPRTAHLLFEERPDDCAAAIRGFIAGIGPRPPASPGVPV